ncbi:MAG: Blue-light-activated protein, partial [Verrucomicrobiales bacterium]|nr:Blue-light-activated protein [Verrucomicrobiales bacterium]
MGNGLTDSEGERLEILRQYAIMDTEPDDSLDDLTHLASHICGAPLAYISLVDEDRQWFKSKIGTAETETPRNVSFCTHALKGTGLLIVPDASKDPRFAGSPLVTGKPHICFYAGAPLLTPEGAALGALCVVDHVPRQLSESQQKALLVLSRQVMTHLNLRRQGFEMSAAGARLRRLNHLYALSSGVNEAIVRSRTAAELCAHACRIAVEKGGLAMAWVGGMSEAGGKLVPVARWGRAEAFLTTADLRIPFPSTGSEDPAVTAFRSRLPIIHNRIAAPENAYPNQAAALLQGFQSCAAFPIRTGEEQAGVLVVYSAMEDFFDTNEVQLLSAVAESISWGLESHASVRNRLRTEEALRASEQLFRDITEVSPDAIFLDRGGRIEYINAAGLRLLHALDPSEILGRDSLTLFAPEFHDVVAGRTARLQGKPCSVPMAEEKMVALDGSIQHVEVAAVSYFSNGEICTQVVCRDISARKIAAAESRRTHDLLKAVADHTTDAVFVKDRAGRYLLCNEAAGRFVGRPPEEFIGHDDATMFGPRDAAVIRENDRLVLQKGVSLTTEEVLTSAGATRTYQATKSPYRDDSGRIVGLIGISRDITAARDAEALIRVSEERLRMVTENAKVGLVMLTPDRRYSYFNKTYLEILEITRPDITGLRIQEVLEDLYKDQIQPRLDRAFAGESVAFELHRLSATGEKYYSVRYEPTLGDSGKVTMVVVVITEVTDRKTAEFARHASEAKYRRLFEYAPDGILIADGDCFYLDANASACLMLGYEREELIGLHTRDIVIPEEFEHIVPALDGIRSKATSHREWRMRRKDGSVFPAEVISTLMPDGNFLAMLRDISGRKAAEAAIHDASIFAQSTIDALSAKLCVLDENGYLLATNAAWKRFGENNSPPGHAPGVGLNYLKVCDAVTGTDTTEAHGFAQGIRAVLAGSLPEFTLEYVCHAPGVKRWFAGRVTRFPGNGPVRIVVAHENITDRKLAEQALLENAEILLEAQSLAQLGHWEWNLVSGQARWSHEIYRIYGRDPALGAAGVPEVAQYFTPESWAGLQRAVETALAECTPYECDAEVVRQDGTRRWITARGTVMRNPEGQITGMHGTVQDITERRQSQEALNSSRVLLTKVIDSTPSYIFATDTAHRYVFVNQAFATFIGRPPDTLLGLTAHDLFPPQKADTFIAANLAIMASGEPVHTDENVLGAVLMTVKFPLRDAQGKVTGICGVSTDITARKLSEGRMRRLMESNIQGIFFWTHGGHITKANDAFLNMIGHTRDDLAAGTLNWQSITPPEFIPADQRALQEIIRNKVCEPYEKEFLRHDGVRLPVLVGAASFDDDPNAGVCFAL